jgi:hypothetical protein
VISGSFSYFYQADGSIVKTGVEGGWTQALGMQLSQGQITLQIREFSDFRLKNTEVE